MKLNYREILASWNPWHLRKRIADYEGMIEMEGQIVKNLLDENIQLKDQRTANYTGLMTECEQLKEENERLKHENRDLNIIVDAMIQNRVEVRFPNS